MVFITFIDYFQSFEYQNVTKKAKGIEHLPEICSFSDYNYIVQYKYTIKELHNIIKHFNIKRYRGTKRDDICNYCTNMLFLSHKAYIIQKLWKKFFIKLFNNTLGPGYGHFELSNNVDDFLTTEKIKDIDYYYFFSFRDKDNFIYTFNLISIASLILNNSNKNPYNRNVLDKEIVDKVWKRMKYNRILNKTEGFTDYKPKVFTITERVNRVFHHMDYLGHYTCVNWILDLDSNHLKRFIFELYEIWNYRALLTREVKEQICPPQGNPFLCLPRNFMRPSRRHVMYSYNIMLQTATRVMEQLCYSAHTTDNQNMGVLYILSALTLVSENARNSLPWLYASVQYN